MRAVFRRVLVGFDGSERARDALQLAIRLADPDSGELLLAYVDERRAFRMPVHHPPAAQLLADAVAAVPAHLQRRAVERTAGSAARGLCELAEEEHPDVLVLGSHRGPEDHTTPGSTALRLVQGAPCAIAIAPVGSRETERFHHVGVAYDGSAEAREALSLAYSLAERDGAAVSVYRAIPRVGVAYAGSSPREVDAAVLRSRLDAQKQLDEAADTAPPGVNPQTVLVHDEPAGITKECDGIVDLLIMGSRGSGPLHRVFAGSVSEALMQQATQPVLVVPRAGVADPPVPGGTATTTGS